MLVLSLLLQFMKLLLLYSVIILSLLACTKKGAIVGTDGPTDPLLTPTQTDLMAHVWLYDSMRSEDPTQATLVQTDPKIEISFKASVYDVYIPGGNKPVTNQFRYETEGDKKMYHWLEGNAKDTSKYFTIETLTDQAWEVSYPDGRYRTHEYYHAK